MTGFPRRTFIKSALTAVGGASLSHMLPGMAFARSRPDPLAATKLNANLALISGAGANVVAARGPDGLVLVDGGARERSAEVLKIAARELGERRVHTLFNTHWHPESTGANERVAKGGARIVAHENTRLWLGTKITTPWDDRTYLPLPAAARPTETIYTTGKLSLGQEQVDYGYLFQAHTDGDIYVFFHEANVLAAGGVVAGAGWPLIDWWTGGWIVGMVNGLKTLLSVANDDTRIVPGNGPVLTRAELQKQHDMYAEIADRLQKMLRKGMSPQEVVAAAPTREFDAQRGDPEQFVTMAFKSLWGQLSPDA